MATYIMLTRLSPEAVTRPGAIADLNKKVEERIRKGSSRGKMARQLRRAWPLRLPRRLRGTES